MMVELSEMEITHIFLLFAFSRVTTMQARRACSGLHPSGKSGSRSVLVPRLVTLFSSASGLISSPDSVIPLFPMSNRSCRRADSPGLGGCGASLCRREKALFRTRSVPSSRLPSHRLFRCGFTFVGPDFFFPIFHRYRPATLYLHQKSPFGPGSCRRGHPEIGEGSFPLRRPNQLRRPGVSHLNRTCGPSQRQRGARSPSNCGRERKNNTEGPGEHLQTLYSHGVVPLLVGLERHEISQIKLLLFLYFSANVRLSHRATYSFGF